jgi:hypothetical protein
MKHNRDRIGEIRQNSQGQDYEIIGFADNKFTVRFVRTGYVVENVRTSGVWKGTIKDYLEISVMGVGYLGRPLDEDMRKVYHRWVMMLRRCYDEESPSFHNYGEKGVYVSDSWLGFANYYDDLPLLPGYDWEKIKNGLLDLDKDKLIPGNKVYSVETCCFLPPEENAIYTYHSNHKRVEARKSTGEVIIAESIGELARKCGVLKTTIQAALRNENRVNRSGWKFKEISNEDTREQ